MKRKEKFTFDDLESIAEGICNFSDALLDEETSSTIRNVKNAVFINGRGRRNNIPQGRKQLPCGNFNTRRKNVKGKNKFN
jgi:hypothetical protein